MKTYHDIEKLLQYTATGTCREDLEKRKKRKGTYLPKPPVFEQEKWGEEGKICILCFALQLNEIMPREKNVLKLQVNGWLHSVIGRCGGMGVVVVAVGRGSVVFKSLHHVRQAR